MGSTISVLTRQKKASNSSEPSTPTMTSPSDLRVLADIISKAVKAVDERCAAVGHAYPSLNDAFNPTNPAEALTVDPTVIQNVMVLIAAANQIIATARLPAMTVFDMSLSFHISSALQAITTANIPEILREAGPEGLHAKDIAAKTFLDADKVSRFLRLLASHHVFREVQPDVWTNNRLSSLLDTMKSTKEIFEDPDNKHVGTPGLAALIEHTTDEVFKGSAIMTEVLQNSANTDSPTDAPLIKSQHAQKPFFEWLEEKQNDARRKRFGAAMIGVSKLDDREAIFKGFSWENLPQGAKVVDVGGGLGDIPMVVSTKFPHLRFVLQDLPQVIEQAKKHWESNNPSAKASGLIAFQAHDFFTPQPVKDANLFLMRMITHDWATSYVVKILKELRAAAIPGKTKLLLIDQIAPYACVDTRDDHRIPGPAPPPVPQPLLPNLGKANSIAYLGDLQASIFMFAVQRGQERTIGNHIDATKEAGWKIVHLYLPPGSIFYHIVAEPI